MNPISPAFVVPLTFSNLSEVRDGQTKLSEIHNLVEISCTTAQPTFLVSWGLSGTRSQDLESLIETPSRGAVIGCQDGTLYVFHPPQSPRAIARPPYYERNTRHHSRGSHLASLPASPSSSNHAPFTVTSRSRIVSGITAEQVEAPKNYVDFEDEPDKLKELLKGRSSRAQPANAEPNFNKNATAAVEKATPPPSVLDPGPTGLKRNDEPRSLLSATNSPIFTPKSLSTPDSPILYPSAPAETQDMNLRCHIIPPRSGAGRSVTGMQLLDDNRLLAVLQETGDLSVFSTMDGSCVATTHVENTSLQPPAGVKDGDAFHDVWVWNYLETSNMGESTILLASAAIDANSPSPPTLETQDNGVLEKSRLVMFEFRVSDEPGPSEVRLDKLGQWYLDGPAQGIGLHRELSDTATFFYVTPQSHFVVRQLRLLPRIPLQPLDVQSHESGSSHLPSIPLPNPFKALKTRSIEHLPLTQRKRDLGRIVLDEEHDVGELLTDGSLLGLRTRNVGDRLRGLAWSDQQLTAFEYRNNGLRIFFVSPVTAIHNLKWINDDTYGIAFADRSDFFVLKAVDANNDDVTPNVISHDVVNVQSNLVHTLTTGAHQALDFASPSELLLTRVTKDGRRQLKCFLADQAGTNGSKQKSRTLWRASREKGRGASSRAHLTSILPLELDLIILGYGDGRLRQSSLAEMCGDLTRTPSPRKTSDTSLDGFVTGLHLVQNGRTKERFIIGGADDGTVAFWTIDLFKLCARWIIFTTPLTKVIQFRDEKVGPLRGCVLCISQDGTIAVIAVDGFQFLYLIPGSASPLQRACLGGDNLLLIYADHRARLWDVRTKEFWRSMGLDKAEELLGQGGWMDLSLDSRSCLPSTVLRKSTSHSQALDCVSTLSLDLERFITDSTTLAKSISTGRDQTRAILSSLDRLRSVLSSLLTPGLNDDIDTICREKLGIHLSPVSLGFSSFGSTSIYNINRSQGPWCISSDVSAARALSIVVVLRALSLFEELADGANTVIVFYATSLASTIGHFYHPPSLCFFARRWFDASNELRQAARILFDAEISRLSDEEANTIVERWQHHLPCLQPTADRESISAALALFLCGYIAAEKYSLLSASTLTDISKSIALYLHDEQSVYRVLAIDLCSRGFHIWQHYVDVMEILRALFTLATSSRKEVITAQNIGAQARLGVLQIASSNTPLFMTTLGLDILNPLNVEHRKSVMQIVAFLIRKRPLVLYPNLPRLMEAVVKSLDPNLTAHRDAVLDTATEVLGHVVKTFPTVDFHGTSQRLAVGTSEGAIVMYDLKTATRLFVLEGHKKRITSCSFSPDGRRLVTLSLEENVVLVWKVGSSFSSFFNPGAPPRQGHGGSQPFKTLSYNVGDEADMTVAGTLDSVRFEWTADRNVKLKIRESVLAFSA